MYCISARLGGEASSLRETHVTARKTTLKIIVFITAKQLVFLIVCFLCRPNHSFKMLRFDVLFLLGFILCEGIVEL